jgi:hypothetical protein
VARSFLSLLISCFLATSALGQAPGSTTVLSDGHRGPVGEPISISVKNADLQDVLRMITRPAGLNLVLDDELQGKTVTLDLDDVPWDQALELVLRSHGLGYEWSGNVLQVGSTSDLMQGLRQRAELRELRQQSGGLISVARTLSNANAGDAEQLVKQHLSDQGRVTLNRRTNTLIIQDFPAVVAKLTGLLQDREAAAGELRTSRVSQRGGAVRGGRSVSWNAWLLESSDSFVQRLDLEGSSVQRVSGSPSTLARAQLNAEDLGVAKLLLGRLTEQGRLEVLEARPFGLAPAARETLDLGTLGPAGAPLRLELALERDGGASVLTFRCYRGSGARLPFAWHGPTDAAWIVEMQPAPGEEWRVLLISPE